MIMKAFKTRTQTTFNANTDGKTRTKTTTTYVENPDNKHNYSPTKSKSVTLLNMKYNSNGDNTLTVKEQYEAFDQHYNLKLTSGTRSLLKELGYSFTDIQIQEYQVDDKEGAKALNKIQKAFEDKMHSLYTKINEMGLINHNLAPKKSELTLSKESPYLTPETLPQKTSDSTPETIKQLNVVI